MYIWILADISEKTEINQTKFFMTKDNWEEIYYELYDLREEFCQIFRKNINDLKYQTKVKENENRVTQIINHFIRIIERHDILYQVILDNKEVDYEDNKVYMDHTGMRNKYVFHSYSNKVLEKLEEILNRD